MTSDLEIAVRQCLEQVLDPCSIAKGHPMSVVDLGLFKSACLKNGHLSVELKITAPGCGMAHHLILASEEVLAKLPGVCTVEVSTDAGLDWSVEDMAPEVRAMRESLK